MKAQGERLSEYLPKFRSDKGLLILQVLLAAPGMTLWLERAGGALGGGEEGGETHQPSPPLSACLLMAPGQFNSSLSTPGDPESSLEVREVTTKSLTLNLIFFT